MLYRNAVAVNHCLNRAAECEMLADVNTGASRENYLRIARAWKQLAKNTEFTEKVGVFVCEEDWLPR